MVDVVGNGFIGISHLSLTLEACNLRQSAINHVIHHRQNKTLRKKVDRF